MITSEKIAEIDLPGILEGEGIQLRRTGKNWQFCCPFHNDRHPSASLFNKGDRWRFRCFGCGESGDSIDFITKLHGLDFKGACQYLGIESGPLSRSQKLKIKKNEQRRKITETFKQWKLAAIDELRDTISTAYQISGRWKTIKDFERGAKCLDPIDDLQGQLNILMLGPKKDRIGIYNRWKARGGLF